MSDILTADQTEQLYTTTDIDVEVDDFCSNPDFDLALQSAINADRGEPDELWKKLVTIPEGRVPVAIAPDAHKLKAIRGMGTVYDFRDSDWSPANGGRIPAYLGIQHIPVIHNVRGTADLVTLRNVLVSQGLMVQQGTDSEGNVALYTPGNRLCWQARGANSLGWGTEHMHYTTGEPWSKKQLRASAWIVQLNERHYGTPTCRASLGDGAGIVRVLRKGQTTHMRVSAAAGYHDRSDPGPGYDFEAVDSYVRFFEKHGHFYGA